MKWSEFCNLVEDQLDGDDPELEYIQFDRLQDREDTILTVTFPVDEEEGVTIQFE